jgi:hypothetical protein
MDLSKVRGGELIAAIGGVVLLIALLFLNWYEIGASVQTPVGSFSASADLGAWDSQGFLGTLANLVMLAAGIAAVGLAVLTASSRTVNLPVAASALTAALGIGAVVMVVGRILFQPGPNGIVDLKFGIFVAVIGALGVAYGGWQSMQEEGTTFEQARESLQGTFANEQEPPAAPPPPAPPPPTSIDEAPGQPPSGPPAGGES